MKFTTIALTAGVATQLASAVPHFRAGDVLHAHLHPRKVVTDIVYKTVVATVTVDGVLAPPTAHNNQPSWVGGDYYGVHTLASTSSSSSKTSAKSSVKSSTKSSSSSVASAENAHLYSTYSAPSYGQASSSKQTSTQLTATSPAGHATSKSSSTKTSSKTSSAASSTSFGYKGRKAGLSGFPDIARNWPGAMDAFSEVIGWYSDYTANTPNYTSTSGTEIQGIPMLWGNGSSSCTSDSPDRMIEFNDVKVNSSYPIPIMFGFYEPDCYCPDSSGINDVANAYSLWQSHLADLPSKKASLGGTAIGSPSMCKQYDETWLEQFKAMGATWDYTSIHINKVDLDGVKKDIEHYWSTYNKPIFVSEFACVQDKTWTPCTDSANITAYIDVAVQYFESLDYVIGYGPSNGLGLSEQWMMVDQSGSGSLTDTGKAYVAAVKKYAGGY